MAKRQNNVLLTKVYLGSYFESIENVIILIFQANHFHSNEKLIDVSSMSFISKPFEAPLIGSGNSISIELPTAFLIV